MFKYFVLLIILISAKANCQNVFTPMDSALIACYPFTGNANDFSGNNLNGTVNSATLTADRFGTPNSAYLFGGYTQTSNIVVPGFNSQLNGTAISISFWTAKSNTAYDAAFMMSPDDASNRLVVSPYYPNLSSGTNIFWDYGDIYSTGRLTTVSTFPATNTWDHWVVVSNSSTNSMKIYQNGSLLTSQGSSYNFYVGSSRDLCIGGGAGVSSSQLWYNGSLDDIKIYKRELLSSEVSYLYTHTISCSPCPAVSTPTNATASSTACIGNSITLSASGSPTLQWYSSSSPTLSVGSGTNYSVPSATSAAGVYTYYVRAFNSCGNNSSLAITFTINAIPALQTISTTSLICVGQSAVLLATGATNYTWLPSNAQSQTLSISPLSTSSYTLNGESDGCFSSTVVVVPVTNLPNVSIASSNSVVCLGRTLTLTSSGATNYTWQPGNVNSSSLVISPPSTSMYTVTGESGGCTNTAVITLPVVNVPTISIAGSSLICLGNTALLLASGAVNYTWFPGNVLSQLLNISPTTNTSYTVIGESAGCSNTAAITMSVVNPPTVSISPSNASICPGAQVSFIASGASGYNWSTGNTTSQISVYPANTSTYSVTAYDANNCSGSATVSVFVLTVGVIHIASTSNTICLGEAVDLIASGASSYTWSTGAQANSVTLNPAFTQTYTVIGNDPGNNCPISESYVQNVLTCTGLSDHSNPDALFRFYPNPTSGSLTFSAAKQCQVIIQNALGDIIYNELQQGDSEIDLRHVSNGIYLVTIVMEQKKLTRKLVKQ